MYKVWHQRFVKRFEAIAEDFLQQVGDRDDALDELDRLLRSDRRWKRHIETYMELEGLTRKELRKEIRAWFDEVDAQAEIAFENYFPDGDEEDAMTDWLTKED